MRVVGQQRQSGARRALSLSRLASGQRRGSRDFPIYCSRLSFIPEVPELEAVAELFLPLK
jgi:DNA gyrase inhibitor GyrI